MYIPRVLDAATKVAGALPGGKYTDAIKQGVSTATSAYDKAKSTVASVKQHIPPEVQSKIKQAVDG